MKKYFLHRPAIILLLLGLFLLTEVLWIVHVYRIEKKDFQSKTNLSILSAIKEENHAVKEKAPFYFMDLRKEDRVIMEYSLRGKHFRIDTIRKTVRLLLNKMLYDFYKENWKLDSLTHYFRRFSPVPDLPIYFARKDAEGKIIDHYPGKAIPKDIPAFPPQLLGNIEKDYLVAWYDFPLAYFWENQKYGLLLSLFPLLLAIYYGILIIKKERTERRNADFIEKQVIFIHDLKTPLCTNRDIEKRILKNLDDWPSEKIQEKLKISRQQSGQLLTEMQKIAIQSAERWGGEIKNQNFNLQKALEELVHNQQCGHEKARITLDYRLEEPEIFADSFHLIHIVDNLIGNALKYAGETAEIRIICSRDKQHRLSISVKDNGPGIPASIQKRIFRLNFRYHPRNPESHGLGLAYIHRIVRQYRGKIKVESSENKGTEFQLTINPEKLKKTQSFIPSTRIYRYFFITLLLAEAIWFTNLYNAERKNFAHHTEPLLEETIFQTNKTFLKWQDTACFENNWQEKTVTITRGQNDTTVDMGGAVNQSYVYGRLAYDLRGIKWRLDSIGCYYQKNNASTSAIFTRIDAAGKTIDRYSSGEPNLFLPVVLHLPLGYVERHQLKIELAYPWAQPLITHKALLLMAFIVTLLSGWFTVLLSSLSRRQRAFVCFQRQKVQHFIRELQTQLTKITHSETEIGIYFKKKKTENTVPTLHDNIEQYENILFKINHLLDQLMMIKSHRFIFE